MDALNRLASKLRNGEIILWAGAGLSKYAGYPIGNDLVNEIKKSMTEVEVRNLPSDSLLEVAQCFIDNRNGSKNELIKLLSRIYTKKPKSLHYHEKLVEIPYLKTIITTNFDYSFESAFGDDLKVLFHNLHVPTSEVSHNPQLYKVHGDCKFPESIVISKSDYNEFYGNRFDEPLWIQIKSLISQHSILFLGYSLEDAHIQYLFKELNSYFKQFGMEHFFVAPAQNQTKVNSLSNYNITYIDSSAEDLIDFLHKNTLDKFLFDFIDGKIDSPSALKLLKKKGISPEFTVSKEGKIKKVEIRASDKSKLDARIRADFESKFVTENIDYFMGKRFGELNIPGEKILNLNGFFNGLNVPLSSLPDEANLKLTSLPKKRQKVNLALQQSKYILENVIWETYSSQYRSESRLIHSLLTITFSADNQIFKNGKGMVNFAFTINPSNSVSHNKAVYDFLYKWIKGDSLMIDSYEEGMIIHLPFSPSRAIRKRLVNEVKFQRDLYEDLFFLQNELKISLSPPKELTVTDLNNIKFAIRLLKRQEMKIGTDGISFKIQNPNSSDMFKDEVFQLRLSRPVEELKIKLFAHEIKVDVEHYDVTDAYVKNDLELNRAIKSRAPQLKLVVGSRSNIIKVKIMNVAVV